MKKENAQYLIETFQPLYQRCKHFECGDGWFAIIKDLSDKLNYIINRDGLTIRATQVKQKFGTLRFYMDSETDEMSRLIAKAEELSATTCETCGLHGKMREGWWKHVLCDECAKN